MNKKGRGLDAPLPEAPRSAFRENAPSRADWRVLGLGLSDENSRFSGKTVAVATQSCCVGFWSLFLFGRTRYAPSRRGMQAICVMGDWQLFADNTLAADKQ